MRPLQNIKEGLEDMPASIMLKALRASACKLLIPLLSKEFPGYPFNPTCFTMRSLAGWVNLDAMDPNLVYFYEKMLRQSEREKQRGSEWK